MAVCAFIFAMRESNFFLLLTPLLCVPQMEGTSVRVVVRVRPLNDKETKSNALPVVTASSQRNELTLVKGISSKATRHTFNFDNVFTSFSSQQEIFEQTLKPIVGDVIRGYESTVFACTNAHTAHTCMSTHISAYAYTIKK
jgi:kinesin family protein 11